MDLSRPDSFSYSEFELELGFDSPMPKWRPPGPNAVTARVARLKELARDMRELARSSTFDDPAREKEREILLANAAHLEEEAAGTKVYWTWDSATGKFVREIEEGEIVE